MIDSHIRPHPDSPGDSIAADELGQRTCAWMRAVADPNTLLHIPTQELFDLLRAAEDLIFALDAGLDQR